MQKKSSLAEIYFFQLVSTAMLGHNWKNKNIEVNKNHFLNILLQLSATNFHRMQVKKSPKPKD